jgi:hydroxyacid-oxoacid transhydrogenase
VWLSSCTYCRLTVTQISGLNKKGPQYRHPGYAVGNTPLIPHGIAVALTGPAVFAQTALAAPARHREALAAFRHTTASDPAIARVRDEDVGAALFDAIAAFLAALDVPRGLSKVGYASADVAKLVEGTLPQRRVLDLAPGIGDVAGEDGREMLTKIIEQSLSY